MGSSCLASQLRLESTLALVVVFRGLILHNKVFSVSRPLFQCKLVCFAEFQLIDLACGTSECFGAQMHPATDAFGHTLGSNKLVSDVYRNVWLYIGRFVIGRQLLIHRSLIVTSHVLSTRVYSCCSALHRVTATNEYFRPHRTKIPLPIEIKFGIIRCIVKITVQICGSDDYRMTNWSRLGT